MKEVIVIGAGISGLATAFEIREKAKAAGEKIAVTVLEKGNRPGGKMHTELFDGYLCEWGPNGYLDSKVHATEFCKRAGLQKELVPASNVVNRRFLFAKGKMRELPDSPPKFFLSGLLSLPGRIRVAFEPLIRPARRGVDESVTEFATRRLGREALEMLLDPFVAGVFAGNPDTLSLKSCFPRIHEMEQTYGSLVKALFALRKKRKAEKKKAKTEGKTVAGATAPRGHLTSLRRGMSQLTDWLANGFGSSLILDCAVTSVDHRDGRFSVQTSKNEMQADAVVLAVPAYQPAKMLSGLAPDAVGPLEAIEYNGLWVVAMGFDEDAMPRPLDGYGFLVPRSEKRGILGCLWSSSIFPGRAPKYHVLLTVMAGGARNPEIAALPEEKIIPLVQKELKHMMGIDAKPKFLRAKQHARAIPQYTLGHAERLAAIDEALGRVPGLFLTGNAYRGVAMSDCILQAGLTADRALEYVAK
jgi:oxygen-dependent protoporphyrinogen oxidase